MHPANPTPNPMAIFWNAQAVAEARRMADHGAELAQYAAGPEGYERAMQAEDERQANEHDAAR